MLSTIDALSQGQAADLVFPFGLFAAFGDHDYLFYCEADGEVLVYEEQAGHGFAGEQSCFGVRFHCVNVVAEDDAVLRSGEFQNNGIAGATKAGILNANDVEVRQSTPNTGYVQAD
jgi:hypothetical protein